MSGLNVTQDIEPAAVGHMDVEQHQVPFLPAQYIQRLVAARGLADRVDRGIRFQELPESRSNHSVIVGDQYS
jgi:hypothetical protein